MNKTARTAKFVNWTDQDFTGFWDSDPYHFKAGESKFLPDWQSRHFAKHLTNRELLKKGMENDTSPKFPEQNPRYMELFQRAYIEVETEGMSESEANVDALNRQEPTNNLPPTELAEPKPHEVSQGAREPFCNQCDSKGVRHKKVCPTLKVEKEFEDLK